MGKIANLTKEEIENFFERHSSLRQILLEIGVNSDGSGAYRSFRTRCNNLEIVIPKFKRNYNYPRNNVRYLTEEILIEGSNYQNTNSLKKRLLREGLLEYKCRKCGIDDWNGEKIVLQLEHKNGINNDNRLCNIELLCPNCHSQTKTYAGKNLKSERTIKLDINIILNSNINFSNSEWIFEASKLTGLSVGYIRDFVKKNAPDFYREKCFENEKNLYRPGKRKVENRPSKEDLEKMLDDNSYVAVGKKYGVSDNAIRKWAKRYGII